MTTPHPSAAEARLLSLTEPEPPRATPEAARNALAVYLRQWHVLALCYAVHFREIDETKWKALMFHLFAEIYRLDPQAARTVVRR